MPSFRITPDKHLIVDTQVNTDNVDFPCVLRLMRDLELKPYGTIKNGAKAVASLAPDGILELTFVVPWPALRQWDNILLLFPDCVDTEILEALRAMPKAREGLNAYLWRAVASISGLVIGSVG